jgi:hypothetical protein
MERSKASTSVLKWSEGLSNRVSIIIRRYIYVAVLFITFLPYSSVSVLSFCICGCMFCLLLFNFVNYVFLLLYILLFV